MLAARKKIYPLLIELLPEIIHGNEFCVGQFQLARMAQAVGFMDAAMFR